ncbi:hypothetical protein AMTR_s00141p00076480 [Amborella trichopoda]|uniref:Uncharacterized protein n=1 Tax=Amborella trichopoda TaxID=13333 RepID=W1PHA0_AMBTC|nr:hypothetical protein AMTR_s00141p00076480 [Amborella trichopoda]
MTVAIAARSLEQLQLLVERGGRKSRVLGWLSCGGKRNEIGGGKETITGREQDGSGSVADGDGRR